MIRKADLKDIPLLTELVLEHYPHYAADKTYYDLGMTMVSAESVYFLAFSEEKPVGYAQCQLRYDMVEGTETSPVGYLEGIYVKGEYRIQGHASRLMEACEKWAKEEGCIEFGTLHALGQGLRHFACTPCLSLVRGAFLIVALHEPYIPAKGHILTSPQ